MIIISCVDLIDFNTCDEVWYITNTTPNIRVGAKHHPELAPSKALFFSYNNGRISLNTLLNEYGSELYSGKYKEAVDNLIHEASTKWIQCVCYCKDWSKCHTNVLYNYLCSLGVECTLLKLEQFDT